MDREALSPEPRPGSSRARSVSSDQILPKLSPGIVVQTVHPRYWSFYTFLLDEFWRRDLPRTRGDFSRFYRPREAIFAIGVHLCDRPEHPRDGQMQAIVGAIRAGALAREGPIVYDAQFDYIKEALGGYGLYYSASIAAMGLTLPALPGAGLPFELQHRKAASSRAPSGMLLQTPHTTGSTSTTMPRKSRAK